MTLACRFAPQAKSDLEEIASFIATDNPARALTFVAELRAHCDVVARQPTVYRLREEYGAGVRVTVHGRYLIFHAVREGSLVIERIIHGARHLEGLTFEQP
jgi:toxin ParE1/3/4